MRKPFLYIFSGLMLFTLVALFGYKNLDNKALTGAASHHAHNHSLCLVIADPTPFEVEQPNGEVITLTRKGTPAVDYVETIDGYTVLLDESDDTYKFAIAGTDGELYITNTPVSDKKSRGASQLRILTGIQKHARYSGKVLSRKLAAYEAQFEGDNQQRMAITGAFPSTGVRKALLLLIDYPDQLQTFSSAAIGNLANQVGYSINGQTGSFRDYYLDASYGQLTVNSDISGWYTAANNKATYGYGNGSSATRPLIREAVDAAEAAGLDFSQYDNDNDGDVDVVIVIHSGRGREESGNNDDIWSHRWNMGSQSVTYDGVYISDYIIQPETYSSTNGIANIGVLTHEFGHALGLPDLYDTDYSSSGIGKWGLMASGTWNNGGRTPAQLTGWAKQELGWTIPTVLDVTSPGSVTGLGPTSSSAALYRINTNNADEYFLLEYRDGFKWDAYLPGFGMIIYHIDESQSSNTNENNYWVDVEQADGNRDLNNDVNSGDGGDPWPGTSNSTSFDCTSNPTSFLYDQSSTNISISNIVNGGTSVSFNYEECSTTCAILGASVVGNASNCTGGTFDQTIDVGYAYAPSSGTLDYSINGITTSVAITSSPIQITLTGLPVGGSPIDVSFSFSAEPTCSLTVTDLITPPLNCPGSNDDVCSALDLSSHINGGFITTSNLSCTAQTNEPIPSGGGCSTQGTWCSNNTVIENSAWYSFTAPSSGSVSITFGTGPDLQCAVWEAASCTDVLSPTAVWMIGANDDSGPVYLPELPSLTCLIPGKQYFIQVDGWNGDEGAFTMKIDDISSPCLVAPTSGAGCLTSYSETSNGYGEWIHIAGGNGEIIASVNDRFSTLGSLDASYNLNASTLRTHTDGTLYLDRDFGITAGTSLPASIRLYLTDTEWQTLKTAAGLSTLNDLTLRRFAGANCGDFSSSPITTIPSLAIESFNGTDHLVQFEIAGFSAFTLQGASAPLPVELSSFSGEVLPQGNEITWATASEINASHFELQSSSDGTNFWTTVSQKEAKGSQNEYSQYSYTDLNASGTTYYRLISIDNDGSQETSNTLVLTRDQKRGALAIFPNPTSDKVTVSFPEGSTSLHVINTTGQLVLQQQLEVGQQVSTIAVTNLPKGLYTLQVKSLSGDSAARLVVE